MGLSPYICEGYLFVYDPGLEVPQEVVGSFFYNRECINVIATKAKDLNQLREITSEDSKEIDKIKNSVSDSVYNAVKKIEYMSKKEPSEPPFEINFKERNMRFCFEKEEVVTVFVKKATEKIYFFFPMPEPFSERV